MKTKWAAAAIGLVLLVVSLASADEFKARDEPLLYTIVGALAILDSIKCPAGVTAEELVAPLKLRAIASDALLWHKEVLKLLVARGCFVSVSLDGEPYRGVTTSSADIALSRELLAAAEATAVAEQMTVGEFRLHSEHQRLAMVTGAFVMTTGLINLACPAPVLVREMIEEMAVALQLRRDAPLTDRWAKHILFLFKERGCTTSLRK